MMQLAPGTQVWLSCRPTDMRKGFDGLAAQVKEVLRADPFSGHLFVFRGKRGDYIKFLLLGRIGVVPVRQAAGEGPVRVASNHRRTAAPDTRPTEVADRRNGLAANGRNRRGKSSVCGIKKYCKNTRKCWCFTWCCARQTHVAFHHFSPF